MLPFLLLFLLLWIRRSPRSTFFPYTTLFRSSRIQLYMNDGQEIVADYNTIGDKIDYYAGMKKEIGNKKGLIDRKSTRLNSSHVSISYAVFCLKKKKRKRIMTAR